MSSSKEKQKNGHTGYVVLNLGQNVLVVGSVLRITLRGVFVRRASGMKIGSQFLQNRRRG